MDDKQTTAITPGTGQRKRGRPRKQRTEPPKVEDHVPAPSSPAADPVPVDQDDNLADDVLNTPPAELKYPTKSEEPDQDEPQAESIEYRTITLRIPVVELSDGNEYQVSKNNPPKQIRARPLTREQGIALGSIRLGMIASGLELVGGKRDFYSGGRRAVPIETKEQAIVKLLDMIGEAIEKK